MNLVDLVAPECIDFDLHGPHNVEHWERVSARQYDDLQKLCLVVVAAML